MQRLLRFSLLAVLLLVPAISGCGGEGGGGVDSGPMFEPLDAGNDTCVNSTTEACSSGGALVYQFCRTEGDTACYLRREGTSYACEACGEVGACDFALLDLIAEQCPAN